jgi:S1-C subfamily serine protease
MLSREAYETATRAQPGQDSTGATRTERQAIARPALGVRARDLDDAERERLHLDGGAVIAQVQAGGPGHAAGLRVGDVIRGIDGMPVTGAQALVQAVGRRRVDERVRLEVWRDGDHLVLQSGLAQPVR